jgi:hypothetical protein
MLNDECGMMNGLAHLNLCDRRMRLFGVPANSGWQTRPAAVVALTPCLLNFRRKPTENRRRTMYLILLLNMSIHSCYVGSKVVLALVALDLGASQFLLGLLIACYGAIPILLGVFAGGWRIPSGCACRC